MNQKNIPPNSLYVYGCRAFKTLIDVAWFLFGIAAYPHKFKLRQKDILHINECIQRGSIIIVPSDHVRYDELLQSAKDRFSTDWVTKFNNNFDLVPTPEYFVSRSIRLNSKYNMLGSTSNIYMYDGKYYYGQKALKKVFDCSQSRISVMIKEGDRYGIRQIICGTDEYNDVIKNKTIIGYDPKRIEDDQDDI